LLDAVKGTLGEDVYAVDDVVEETLLGGDSGLVATPRRCINARNSR